jgi:glycosyltransferase involved in cell wall biosynthesis
VAVIVPVYGNAATLRPLTERLAVALAGRDWVVHLVVDASPDDSAQVAQELATVDPRLRVTVLARNVGQHRALVAGLVAEPDADAWACLDADLQDPPEAVPALLDRLAAGDVVAVFAGRRGSYESRLRLLTGRAHRRLMAAVTGLPPDAGAFLAMGPAGRETVLERQAPSLVAGLGAARLPVASVPVARLPREHGRSAWSTSARLRHSARTLLWTMRQR